MVGVVVLLSAQAYADPKYPQSGYRWYMNDFNEGAFLTRPETRIIEDRKMTRFETNNGNITIESTGELILKPRSISIKPSTSMEITASATAPIKGSLVQIN